MTIKIKPTTNASKRTKQRIKERGPWFTVERKHDDETFGIDGSKAISFGLQSWLLRGSREWVGWIPKDEFEILDKVTT